MKKFKNKFSIILVSLLILGSVFGVVSPEVLDYFSNDTVIGSNTLTGKEDVSEKDAVATSDKKKPDSSKESIINDFQGVADYIHKNNALPNNFITKDEAKKLGWNPGEDLWKYAPDKSIGGDYFGNHEGTLPSKSGRKWTECDINYNGGSRGGDRIVFSNDGLIYGTSDHYKTFKQYY
ncbi:MAG: ribonuclease domain-containing protein [Clostridium sp.]|uniref:ribonuclease domain-containing protein n=1 Tax=Clostridium sp. TaxID=1506 RepID=UPI0030316154